MLGKLTALDTGLLATRIVQILCLLPLIGITAHLTSCLITIRESFTVPASPTWHLTLFSLVLACLATIYSSISLLLILDGSVPFLLTLLGDVFFMIPAMVVTILMDKYGSLSRLSCSTDAGSAENASDLTSALGVPLEQWTSSGDLPYTVITRSAGYCRETKSIWALFISMLTLFFVSAVITVFIWNRQRRVIPSKDRV